MAVFHRSKNECKVKLSDYGEQVHTTDWTRVTDEIMV